MILGDTCTRACAFCNVKTGMPRAVDRDELAFLADALGDEARVAALTERAVDRALARPRVERLDQLGEAKLRAVIADFYDEEVSAAVKALTSIMEPVMIILVGGIVGVIVISMYLPLFSVYNSIK